MATVSLDIYTLIQSLSRTEKAYFKKFGYKYDKGEDKSELQLFDWIDRELKKVEELDEFFEAKIQRIYSKSYSVSSYSKKKTNLYYAMLATLREYEKGKLIEEKVLEYFQYAQILMKRSLFKEALPFMKKADSLAKEHELFEFNIYLSQQYSVLLSILGSSKTGKESLQKLEESLESIMELEEVFQMEKTYFELAFLQKTKGLVNDKNELEKINQQELDLKSLKDGLSNRSELYKLESLSTIAILKGDQSGSYAAYQKIIELLDQSAYLRQTNLQKYIVLYEQFLQMSLLSFQKATFEEKYISFLAIETTNNQEQAWKENADIFLQGIYAILDNKLNLYVDLENRFYSILDKMPSLVPGYRKISISYYMVSGFFMLQEWEKVADWYNFIHNNRNLGVRYDVDLASRIMYLLSLFECKELELFDYHLKAFRNFIAAKSVYSMDAIISSLLGKLLHEVDVKALERIYKDYESKVAEHLAANPNDMAFMGVFDIVAWLQAKLRKEDFYTVWCARNLPK